MKRRILIGATLGSLALTSSLLAPAAPAKADAGCMSGIGSKQAVVFVHGFNEGRDIWSSLDDRLKKTVGVKTTNFGYERYNHRWVTDPNIGKALANQIACMSASSSAEGGTGIVDVIAHSMGGDAARQALKIDPSLKNKVVVATLGTPNTGSDIDQKALDWMSKACAANLVLPAGIVCGINLFAGVNAFKAFPALASGSQEMRDLPDWPSSVPVLAIAGNVVPTVWGYRLGTGITSEPGKPSGTDGLVTVESAEHGNRVHGLGGVEEYRCVTKAPFVPPLITVSDCSHNALLTSNHVQDLVVQFVQNTISTYTPENEAPAPSSAPASSCPTTSQIEQAVQKYSDETHLGVASSSVNGSVVCQSDWAVASVTAHIQGGSDTDGAAILRRRSGTWVATSIGSNFVGSDECQTAPSKIRARLGCG